MDTVSLLLGLLAILVFASLFGFYLLHRYAHTRFDAGKNSRGTEFAVMVTELEHQRQQLVLARSELQQERDSCAAREFELNNQAKKIAVFEANMVEKEQLANELERQDEQRRQLEATLNAAQLRNAELAARIEEQASASGDKLRWVEQAREALMAQFQALAGEILEQKSERFTAQNVEQVGRILDPLREQIRNFQNDVNESRKQEGEQRAVLKSELENLRGLNLRLGEDALNLTRALRGDSRAQGAWGEMILERLLESAGLVIGREFETQLALRDDQQILKRPDVIIRLPEGRDVVIDAKVSLTAYERLTSATNEEGRRSCLEEHVGSMRKHLDDLSSRKYSELPGLQSLDFVLMFVPVEAAYLDAMRIDPGLYERALKRGIVIASPGMLLGILRTIKHLWRIEERRSNAQLIAERAGFLYEKFHGLLIDIEAISRSVDVAAKTVHEAKRKLQGKGNLAWQIEELKRLGARTQKELPRNFLDGEDA